MASSAELGQNIPDTLPADFGEWDNSDSSDAFPADAPAIEPRETAPKESRQREFARREAETVDSGKKPAMSREVSREYEPARNVTPFPEPDSASMAPRGFPAPSVRAPRGSAAAATLTEPSHQDDSAFLRRLKSFDTVADALPAIEAQPAVVTEAKVSLMDRKPDKPLFSSTAPEEPETTESEPTLLNDLIDNEEERRTRRKWITSVCIFGGSILLVAFQLFHYGTAGKIKHIVTTTQAASTTATDPTLDSDSYTDSNQVEAKPSAAKQANGRESQQSENSPAKVKDAKPALAQTEMMQFQLMAPRRLPQNVKTSTSNDAPPPASLGGASIDALNGNTTANSVFAGRQDAQVSGPRTVPVSAGVATGLLIHKQQPVYPAIARSARVQGTVVLDATIARNGQVTNLKIVSGPPMLRQAAIDAVKNWQYKPYTLNNQPTDVSTTVNVVFSLGG